jgi:hypothetical protein
MRSTDHEDVEPSSSVVLIGNEFARVRLEVVPGPHGDHLRISSIRTGWTRTLSPTSVERLSRLSIGPYLDALETPFGPEPDLALSTDFPLSSREESEHEPAETDLGRAGRDGSR